MVYGDERFMKVHEQHAYLIDIWPTFRSMAHGTRAMYCEKCIINIFFFEIQNIFDIR